MLIFFTPRIITHTRLGACDGHIRPFDTRPAVRLAESQRVFEEVFIIALGVIQALVCTPGFAAFQRAFGNGLGDIQQVAQFQRLTAGRC